MNKEGYRNRYTYVDRNGRANQPEICRTPRKQNLTDEEISQQNIPGYIKLVEAIFKPYNYVMEPQAPSGLSNPSEIVKAVELTLAMLQSPRQERALRLRFRLDEQGSNDNLMNLEHVGIELKDQKNERPIKESGAKKNDSKWFKDAKKPCKEKVVRSKNRYSCHYGIEIKS